MTYEEFMFRIGSLFLFMVVILFWFSQKTDKISTDICAYFFILAFAFAISGVLFTFFDLAKWFYDLFKG